MAESTNDDDDDLAELTTKLSVLSTSHNSDVAHLRDYQERIVSKIEDLINDGCPSALVYLATGGGKTRIALELALNEINKGGSVLIIVNRGILTTQTEAAFRKCKQFRVDVIGDQKSFEKKCLSGDNSKKNKAGTNVYISTIQMFKSRFTSKKPTKSSSSSSSCGDDVLVMNGEEGTEKSCPILPQTSLVIFDECHCTHAPIYQALIKAYQSQKHLSVR